MDAEKAKAAIRAIRASMEENQDRLIEVDAIIGDGDLGLTMKKAFVAADETASASEETAVGTLFAKVGMAMAKAAPSTMGTLVATGFMRGGKAVKGKTELDAPAVAAFFRAFSDGVIERGKTAPGNKTLVDVTDPVATALEAAVEAGADLAGLAERAREAAGAGEEAAKGMMSQHGKAAVFREKTIGAPDPGATATAIIVRSFFSVFT
jgi:dihydroxyacetone kinase-like protein